MWILVPHYLQKEDVSHRTAIAVDQIAAVEVDAYSPTAGIVHLKGGTTIEVRANEQQPAFVVEDPRAGDRSSLKNVSGIAAVAVSYRNRNQT